MRKPPAFIYGMLALLWCAAAHSAPLSTSVPGRPDVIASLDIPDGPCPSTLQLRIDTSQPSDFDGRRILGRLVAWAQISASSACPHADAIQVKGTSGGHTLFEGIAHRSQAWALSQTPAVAGPQRAPETVAAQTSVLPSAPPQQPRANAEAEQIRACDRLAAHPDDPEAVTAGIADNKLNAANVVQACSLAIKADPATPRLHFQLARGLLAAERIEDAVEELILAAQGDHGGALAYLADLQLEGAPGIDADPGLARQLYEKAVASGFEPAKAVLAEFTDMTDEFARMEAEEAASTSQASVGMKPYANPTIIEGILNRQFDAITANEWWVKSYLVVIADNIRGVCESGFTKQDIAKLEAAAEEDVLNIGSLAAPANLLNFLTMLNGAQRNPKAAIEDMAGAANDEEAIFLEGMKDTEALFQRHLCKTPGLEKFGKNLRAFVLNEDAPPARPNALMSSCMKNHPSSKYPSDQYCMCFLGNVQKNITQGERKALLTDFKSTALKMADKPKLRASLRPCRAGF